MGWADELQAQRAELDAERAKAEHYRIVLEGERSELNGERALADDLADVLDRCHSSFRSAADKDISDEVQRVMARYREARGQ